MLVHVGMLPAEPRVLHSSFALVQRPPRLLHAGAAWKSDLQRTPATEHESFSPEYGAVKLKILPS